MAAIAFYGVLWLEGANDVIADHFDVSLYLITEIARCAVFVVPVLAYWLTKRICLGLQRKDLHLLEHGVETGIIRQLPNGEFIEETKPLDEEEVAVLDPGKPALSLPEASDAAAPDVPPPDMRGGVGRVRQELNKVVTESVPMNGHGYGYGNGHGDGHGNGHREGEPAAIPSGSEHDQDTGDGSGHDGQDHRPAPS